VELISDMLLVVHVPKTAGTSFRQALEKYFGVAQVIRDYGPNAPATLEIVQNYLYRNEKPEQRSELVQAISENSAKVLIGHFSVQKYGRFFKQENIIGFVRDPLERTCSEYVHRMNNATFEGSFSDFINEPGVVNIQSRYLQGISEKSLIGLTEKYSESLMVINDSFQLKLSTLNRNIDKAGGGKKFATSLSKQELDLFYTLNEEDMVLYRAAAQRFNALDIPEEVGNRFVNWLKRKDKHV